MNEDMLTLKYDEKNVLGTADYVAPEQAINSHEVDIRADIYSLGATFYFLLAGQPPFPEGKAAQKLIWHQMKEPTPVHELRPEVPKELSALVAKMMCQEAGRPPRDAGRRDGGAGTVGQGRTAGAARGVDAAAVPRCAQLQLRDGFRSDDAAEHDPAFRPAPRLQTEHAARAAVRSAHRSPARCPGEDRHQPLDAPRPARRVDRGRQRGAGPASAAPPITPSQQHHGRRTKSPPSKRRRRRRR